MEDQTIIDERHGAVAPIITNRPRYKNAGSGNQVMLVRENVALQSAELRGIFCNTFSAAHYQASTTGKWATISDAKLVVAIRTRLYPVDHVYGHSSFPSWNTAYRFTLTCLLSCHVRLQSFSAEC
jgi:hypothetical protein